MTNGSDDDPTKVSRVREVRPSGAKPPAGGGDPSAETRILRGEPGRPAGGPPAAGGEPSPDPGRTIVHRQAPRAPQAAAPGPAPSAPPKAAPQEFDPVVGWLVVLEGPGRGASIPIYEGMNSAGRETNQRISINFGDSQISREGHFFLTYEPKKRNFYVNHGGKTNLIYKNDEVVLGPELLNKGDTLKVGATKLMFVPLCGPDFNWDSMA